MIDRVTLETAETRICVWVGEQRFAHARRESRDPGAGPTSTAKTAVNDIRGAKCEFSGSIMLNVYWRPSIGSIRDYDVGGLVQVRSGTKSHHRLIVKPADKDHDPFALILAIDDTFYFGGWLFASAAKLFPLESGFGDPAHFVPQSALRPQSELIDWINTRRSPALAEVRYG